MIPDWKNAARIFKSHIKSKMIQANGLVELAQRQFEQIQRYDAQTGEKVLLPAKLGKQQGYLYTQPSDGQQIFFKTTPKGQVEQELFRYARLPEDVKDMFAPNVVVNNTQWLDFTRAYQSLNQLG